MRKFCKLSLLFTCNMITLDALLVQTGDRAWYVIGGESLIVNEQEGLTLAYRVGVGPELNGWFGFELLWDSAPSLQPRRLIQNADLPMTITPTQNNVQSHFDRYLTTMGVIKIDFFQHMLFLGKAGIAQHSLEREFDILSSGTPVLEGVKVEDRSTVPVISVGIELLTNQIQGMSIQYRATQSFEGDNIAIMMTASIKFMF